MGSLTARAYALRQQGRRPNPWRARAAQRRAASTPAARPALDDALAVVIWLDVERAARRR
jgi:hypothetical protein